MQAKFQIKIIKFAGTYNKCRNYVCILSSLQTIVQLYSGERKAYFVTTKYNDLPEPLMVMR